MFLYLLMLFTLVPALELYLLIKIGADIGLLNTVAIVVLTGIVGAALAKKEGLKVWADVNGSLSTGQVPTDSIIDGVLIFVAGGVLLTPGFLTDTIGVMLLIAPVRAIFREFLKRKFQNKIKTMNMNSGGGFNGTSGFYYGNNPFENGENPFERQNPPTDKPDVIITPKHKTIDDEE